MQEASAATTPTKSTHLGRTPALVVAGGSKSTPTSTTARRTPRSSRVAELAAPEVSASKRQRMEEDMGEHTSRRLKAEATQGSRNAAVDADAPSPARRSTRNASASQSEKMQATTPTKVSTAVPKLSRASAKPVDRAAFDDAMTAPSASKAPTATSPTKSATAAATAARKRAAESARLLRKAEEEEEQRRVKEEEAQEQEVPYEPYWDDMLLRARSSRDWEARLEETERWRKEMFGKLVQT